jgi:hypothetical protein
MNVFMFLFILYSFINLWMHIFVHIGMNVFIYVRTCVCVNACMLHPCMQWFSITFFTYEEFILATLREIQNVFFQHFWGHEYVDPFKNGKWYLCAHSVFTIHYARTVNFVWPPMCSLGFFIELITPATLDSECNRNEYQKYLLTTKSGRCVAMTTLLPSCADRLENLRDSIFWNPKGLSRSE